MVLETNINGNSVTLISYGRGLSKLFTYIIPFNLLGLWEVSAFLPILQIRNLEFKEGTPTVRVLSWRK